MNRLVIGIIIWNNVDDAIACADSLLEQTNKDFTVLLLNNNSTDPNVAEHIWKYIKKASGTRMVYLESDKNNGTAGGFNTIARWAKENDYEFFGSLNADAVADRNWVDGLLKAFASGASIVTGTLLHANKKTIDTTGDFYTSWGLPGPRLRDQSSEKVPSNDDFVFAATGGGFIAKTSLIESVGKFDETFFMYYEDVDWCFRAQLLGNTVRYTPSAVAFHKRGSSSQTVPGLAIYNTFKNLPILFVKNVPLSLCWRMYPRFVLMYALILGNAIRRGNGIPALKGWLMSWRYLVYTFRERLRIQQTRTVEDSYLNSIILDDIPPDQVGLRKFRKFFTGK